MSCDIYPPIKGSGTFFSLKKAKEILEKVSRLVMAKPMHVDL